MNPQSQSLMRSITGPLTLITVGVLFTIERITGGRVSFGETWPVLLIVIGILRLLGGRRPKRMNAGYYAPPFNPQAPFNATPYSTDYNPQAPPPPPPVPGERR